MKPIIAILIMTMLGCAANTVHSTITQEQLIGKWESRDSSFLSQGGWDSCEFKASKVFACSNYPKDGDLVLPYDGTWELNDSVLAISIDTELKTISVTKLGPNKIKLITQNGKHHIYHRQ